MSFTGRIFVAYFTAKTLCEFHASEQSKFYHFNRMTKPAIGDIVVLVHIDDKAIVGVAMLKGRFEEHHLLDTDTYTGDDAKYNKYEIAIHKPRWLTHPLSLAHVGELCGVPASFNGNSNLMQKSNVSWAESFIKPRDETTMDNSQQQSILAKYRALITSLL
jgi:hypothetical protein